MRAEAPVAAVSHTYVCCMTRSEQMHAQCSQRLRARIHTMSSA